MVQLDFFLDPEEIMFDEIRKIKDSTDKVRKSLYARHNDLDKKYNDLLLRLEILERNICVSASNLC